MNALDIHCHILPGLDDGSPDMATSIAMARLAVAAGIGTMIGTPHWIADEHETDPEVVRQAATALQAELNARAIPLTILPGNEAFICPDLPDRVKAGDVLTLADRGTHLLLELPYEDLATYVDDVVFRLQVMGIIPVLAHVERYAYVRSDWHVLDRWVQHGCLAQVNASSLDRGRGDDLAQDLMDRGLVACTATDAHDAAHRAPRSIWNKWGASLLKGGS
ncbi:MULTISPECIES: tyrosine-protein phosphatase [Candidatus Cryosericum]|jgi:protein-tyrosine phosphatase|uniref:protein-tyrosine-phosphatase n=2 Tax=Candidatus Cryosericum TaxID=2498709 RepID=A0A398DM89_9BACT|nr:MULTISPECIES: CpsB/CapC family capsule biosynthesis tyrosine phosphatase [Cryosericum]RIE08082.1 capsular biosynthesis protein [Candidatus Cryosericum odellii]RIE08289.1 capsular biosynthesis protein [Candidatus Cryosericum hinesii]RIE11902.1 capsular biosynthesis protein [Candidatus Cryosericum hinesii]RIE11971.1 capsular biosynthesis protein [Candidatus Cryosericum hinesii]